MSDLRSKLRARVDAFVDDLEEIVRELALEAVSDALGDAAPRRALAAAPAPEGRGRRGPRRGPRARPKGQKRTSAELGALTTQMLADIKDNPGERIEQIAARLGVASKELHLPTRKLLADKKIRKQGQKRATVYFHK